MKRNRCLNLDIVNALLEAMRGAPVYLRELRIFHRSCPEIRSESLIPVAPRRPERDIDKEAEEEREGYK